MTLKEYIDTLTQLQGVYGDDIEIVSFSHIHTTAPSPAVFYDEDLDVIVTD